MLRTAIVTLVLLAVPATATAQFDHYYQRDRLQFMYDMQLMNARLGGGGARAVYYLQPGDVTVGPQAVAPVPVKSEKEIKREIRMKRAQRRARAREKRLHMRRMYR